MGLHTKMLHHEKTGYFAPGIISTGAHEYACCFSPDGHEFYFTRQNKVMVTRLVEGVWTGPVELNLGMEAGQPCGSPDGKYLFFSSGHPKIGSDIYRVAATCIEALRPQE